MTDQQILDAIVFPAYAGMIRLSSWTTFPQQSVPRLRGDDPLDAYHELYAERCSPPTRG